MSGASFSSRGAFSPAWVLAYALTGTAFPQCGPPLKPTSDYAFLTGVVPPGASYRWLRNGEVLGGGVADQRLLLHLDNNAVDADGKSPTQTASAAYTPGKWGSALSNGSLTYAREGTLDLNEGTIEMWIALAADGEDPRYSDRDTTLFQYRGGSDDLRISQSRASGVLYGGGTVRGQWESAYNGAASMKLWRAGEWHHIAFTWSAAANQMRFHVDGVRVADTNERHYWPPAETGASFTLSAQNYLLDEIRLSARALEAAELRASASRTGPFPTGEILLPLSGIAPGDRISLEADGCASREFAWRGIPLEDADPPSTLLPPGATSLAFSLKSRDRTACRYSVNGGAWTAFDGGQGSTTHNVAFRGLDPDPARVNTVAVRCDSDPEYELRLMYRSLPEVSPNFPRKGNLWGSSNFSSKGLDYASRIDLWLGASWTPGEMRALRRINPNTLILTSINVVENFGLPDDYYLKDTKGNRIEVWPGTYRLNLTKRYVAEYQARYAYQRIIDSGLMFDGCFFDNFFTTQSWLKADIYGNPVQLDADEDGKPDDPAVLDAKWKEGVYYELELWRKLMPYALASGHLPRPPSPEFSRIYNGDSIGFMTADVIEGKRPFGDLWAAYNDWWEIGRKPVITMVESSPHDQIAYGYDYDPLKRIPPSTLEFARTYFPNVRFGLAFTLMNDGFFAHEFGDTWHGNDWWYDELDFNLGSPYGPAARLPAENEARNLVDNSGFEHRLEGTWQVTVNSASGASASAALDTSTFVDGAASARITIASAGQGIDWHVDFNQRSRSFTKGVQYDLEFWAKADTARTIGLSSQKQSPDWRNYGLSRQVAITTEWKKYSVTFEARETVDDSRLQFFLGARAGTVWIDAVSLAEHPPDVYRRDFVNGMALLNATREQRTIPVGPGWRRLKGSQAPRYQYLLDDKGPEFSASAEWKPVNYDSGEWKATGPFYHNWFGGCRRNDGTSGEAKWDLALRGDDTYTIEAWWPAAPDAPSWSRRVVFEVVAAGKVVASAVMDQTSGGDQWHEIATLPLKIMDQPFVRVRNEGSGAAIADALHVRSASRYNDGSIVESVTLEPMDGIVLERVR